MDKTAIKNQLNASRKRLLEVLARVGDDQWDVQVQSKDDLWTVIQMVRHLQDAHVGLTGQIERALAGERTVPEGFDLDRWNKSRQVKLADQTPEEALEKLSASHERLIDIVVGLTEEDLKKTGYSTALKKVITIDRFLQVVAMHEVTHAAEIAAALEKHQA